MGYTRFEVAIGEEAALFDRIAETLKTLSDRDATRQWLRALPDNESAGFAQLLPLLPKLVFKIREFAPAAIKELPHAPGGRPSLSTITGLVSGIYVVFKAKWGGRSTIRRLSLEKALSSEANEWAFVAGKDENIAVSAKLASERYYRYMRHREQTEQA